VFLTALRAAWDDAAAPHAAPAPGGRAPA